MRLTHFLRSALLIVGLALGALALASPAMAAEAHSAGTVKVKGGQTSLTVAKGTAAVLSKNGVVLTPVKPATAHGATFSFPITGGSVNPKTAAGTISHSGGLRFRAGHTTLTVNDFVIDTTKGVLTARVADTQTRIPLLKLDTSKAKISADGGCLTIGGVQASLTAEAATALNKTFHVTLFTGGLPIGVAKVSARD